MSEMVDVQFKPRAWLVRATVLAGSLGLVHILATPLYFGQWLGYGIAFVAIAVVQVMYSMVLAVNRPRRVFFWAGIVGNALIIVVWLVTRTVGVPMGPMMGEVLPVGFLDGLAQVLEVIQIVHLSVLLYQFDELQGRPLIQ
ncbi:MAG: hypothetical protein P8129_08585 [Anaerolineae bacterium]|jgi:hypothetical protein